MRPGLATRLSRFLVRCYPPRWRQRYAEELLEVLDQHQPTSRTVLNLWAGAVSAQLDPAWRTGRHPAIRLRRRVRIFVGIAAVLLVFAVGVSFLARRDEQGNTGPPMPLSDGVFAMAFSPAENGPFPPTTVSAWPGCFSSRFAAQAFSQLFA